MLVEAEAVCRGGGWGSGTAKHRESIWASNRAIPGLTLTAGKKNLNPKLCSNIECIFFSVFATSASFQLIVNVLSTEEF